MYQLRLFLQSLDFPFAHSLAGAHYTHLHTAHTVEAVFAICSPFYLPSL